MSTLLEYAQEHLKTHRETKVKMLASGEPMRLPTDDERRVMQHRMYVASGSMGSTNIVLENKDV